MKNKHFYTAVILFLFLAVGIQPAVAVTWILPPPEGETYPFGTWDSGSSTFTLTGNPDVGDNIQIIDDDLTLDGAGKTVNLGGSLGDDGVDVADRQYVTIQNLNVTGCRAGITLDSSDYCTITNNTVSACYYGIHLQDSTYITVNNNNINSNTDTGILIVAYGNNNILSNNTVSTNTIGITIGGTARNTKIYNNTVSDNGFKGIYVCQNAQFNNIYNNNFINTLNADVIGYYNVFDLGDPGTGGKGGNYWSNWCPPDHPDTDPADGIVDEPYLMPPYYNRGQDNYPWAVQDGWLPVANAGTDQTVECACQTPEGTQVTLVGTGSTGALTYKWTGPFVGSPITVSDSELTVTLNVCLDEYEISLIVNNGQYDSEPDTVTITVVDTTPPVISCPGDTTVEAMDPDGVPVDDERIQTFLNGASATDNCDPEPTITNDAPVIFPPGEVTTVTFTATDASGNSSSCSSKVTVVEAAESNLRIIPQIINREGRLQRILAVIRFPEGVTEDDIDIDLPLMLFPGDNLDGIEAISQRIVSWYRRGTLRVSVFASSPKDEVTAAVPEDGPVEMMVIGRFMSGQYFYGLDTARIISWNWRRW